MTDDLLPPVKRVGGRKKSPPSDTPKKRPGRGDPAAKGGGYQFNPPAGAGYGGPAKGAHTSSPRPPNPRLKEDGTIRTDAEIQALAISREPLRIATKERAERFKDIIYAIADDETLDPNTRLNAAYKGVTLIEGNPTTRIAGPPEGEAPASITISVVPGK